MLVSGCGWMSEHPVLAAAARYNRSNSCHCDRTKAAGGGGGVGAGGDDDGGELAS